MKSFVLSLVALAALAGPAAALPQAGCASVCIAPVDAAGSVVLASSGSALPSPYSVAPGGPDRPVIRPVPLVGVFR